MATQKWIAGTLASTYQSAFGSELNSMSSGDSVLSSLALSNGTGGDVYAMLSLLAGATSTTGAPGSVAFGIYPLGQDGSTYGDGQFTTTPSAALFPINYGCATISVRFATIVVAGTTMPFLIPPGTFKFICANLTGANFASSMTCKYITQNLQVS